MDMKSTTVSLRTRSRVFFALGASTLGIAAFLAIYVGIGIVSAALALFGAGLVAGGIRDLQRIKAGEETAETGKPLGHRILVVAIGLIMCLGFLAFVLSM